MPILVLHRSPETAQWASKAGTGDAGKLVPWGAVGTVGLGCRGARSPLQPQPGSGVFCLTGELLVWQGWEGPSHLKEDASAALTMAKLSL